MLFKYESQILFLNILLVVLHAYSVWYYQSLSIARLSKRLLRVSDQAIASQSNQLLYADYVFLSFISLIVSLFISLLY